MAAVLYADVADLRLTLGGTDSGTGTAAALSDDQLTLAIKRASNTVSVYAGGIYDSSTPGAVPPDIFNDLTLDIAAWISTLYYRKGKALAPTDPVQLRYASAMQMLEDARDGKIVLTVGVTGSDSGGRVINRIPNIFSPLDSNTRYNPVTGYLEADTPLPGWAPSWLGLAGDIEAAQG